MSNNITIDSIIRKLGGCDKIAEDIGKTPALVRSWRQNGISWWHWWYVMKHGNFRAGEIYNASVAVAGEKYGIPIDTRSKPKKKDTSQAEAA